MLTNIDIQKIADELDFDLIDVEMLIEVFLETAEETLKSLYKAILSDDFESIYKLSHSIKGSASNLLLNKIVELSKTLEFEANAKNKINYKKLYFELTQEVEKLKNK